MKLAVICGGPSKERGVSLNSARSFLDHALPLDVELAVLYVDPMGGYHRLSVGHLYSNTPSDFDFKLGQIGKALDEGELVGLLREMDLVFPLIHGVYGEDGTLQAFLEAHGIPFVGTGSEVCRQIFNKYLVRKQLNKHGFSTLPCLRIGDLEPLLETFWKEQRLSRAVVKPTLSGSSIGVVCVDSPREGEKAIADLRGEGFQELIVEPYCEDTEFTVCVLENREGEPVSLIPLEIDLGGGAILDYRKKYLSTDQARYYCPPRFEDRIVDQIRGEAERLFKRLGLRHLARIDGWVSKSGNVRFADLNPLSGMEQNSFLFQQSSRIGISHTELIQYVLGGVPKRSTPSSQKKKVFVLMGGVSSERQVSLMSGTNVWLKLLHSQEYEPIPFVLEQDETVWQLPYSFALHHSMEELVEHCKEADSTIPRVFPIAQEIRQRLGMAPLQTLEHPISMKLAAFIQKAKEEGAFVFIALHGGIGEDGTLQNRLERAGVSFNGSSALVSRVCMDKHLSALYIESLGDPDILSMPQLSFDSAFKTEAEIEALWQKAIQQLGSSDLLIKPQCDGCSTGIVRLESARELGLYLAALQEKKRRLPIGTFRYQQAILEMPATSEQPFLLEPFIQTDRIQIQRTELIHQPISGWCEMTIGVLEKGGDYTAFQPSVTAAESGVLSVEEKFQGGTGVNITPPPDHLLSPEIRKRVQERVCKAAKVLGLRNYARIDLFVEWSTGKIQILEANTLPALTPSTVLYHQALQQTPPLSPRELLETIINSLGNTFTKRSEKPATDSSGA